MIRTAFSSQRSLPHFGLADRGFSSRDNVQGLVDRGTDPVIRPQESATPRKSLKYPAWVENITKFKKLGYEKWRDKTGYGRGSSSGSRHRE
jgi:hypothetical protein